MGDGSQTNGGLADVPDGMLCDNGNPTGCNFMQVRGRYVVLARNRDEEMLTPTWTGDTDAVWAFRAAPAAD